MRLQSPYGKSDSCSNPRAKIHLSYYVPQDGCWCSNASLVWRAGRQNLRDDSARYGQGETHSEQSQCQSCSLYHPRKGHWTRILSKCAHSFGRRAPTRAANHQPQVLDGEDSPRLEKDGYVLRDYLCVIQSFRIMLFDAARSLWLTV